MRCTWLGWAGVELEADGERIVIDPLADPAGLYRILGDAAAGVHLPRVVQASADRTALAALVTHLHRDHADAGALASALGLDAPVLLPEVDRGPGIAQASGEIAKAGLTVRPIPAWETTEIGPFKITALPAVDGTGETQLSWAVEAGGTRIIHCGDTLFHGWWWPMVDKAGPFDVAFLPINGAVVNFPWRQPASPLPAAMTPEHAVAAATALAAERTVPIHYDGYDLDPYYRSIQDAGDRFHTAAGGAGVDTLDLDVGESYEP